MRKKQGKREKSSPFNTFSIDNEQAIRFVRPAGDCQAS